MDNLFLNYCLSDDTVVFYDTIKNNAPYVSNEPRNHESLFFVTKGNLLYEKCGNKYVISKGQVGYISMGSVDKSSAHLCDEVSYIAVNFCFDRKNAAPDRTLPFGALCSENIAYNYEKSFFQALNCFLSKTPGHITICNGFVMQIIGHLYNEYKIQDTLFSKMRKIEKAMIYLKENYSDPTLKIRHLADISYMSEKHFRRLFCDVYKKTPYSFLQDFRVEMSEILLSNTRKSISDIAVQCGFSDVYSFSHCFKKHTGSSPAEYRTKLL